jgi:predicted NAD/FAD-dependent oxidoreductase
VRAIVVGAGLSGLVAARTLVDAGHDVTVFDKGRGPGGRMATRRIGAARFDHGAQFFTVRDATFAAMVERWLAEGRVREWCRGFGDAPDGHPRYVAEDGMNALAKHLATGLDVRCSSLVFGVARRSQGPERRARDGWTVQLDDASRHDADALVLTCPLPQTYSLLVGAEVSPPDALFRTDYERTLTLLAVLDGPSGVPGVGGLQGVSGFTFIGDNQRKGISPVPAVTFHADPAWSAAHWDDPVDVTHRTMIDLCRPWFGSATLVDSQLKRWRFATPVRIWPEPCWQPETTTTAGATIAVAGDALAGPRVEGAILSGLAAGRAIAAALAA